MDIADLELVKTCKEEDFGTWHCWFRIIKTNNKEELSLEIVNLELLKTCIKQERTGLSLCKNFITSYKGEDLVLEIPVENFSEKFILRTIRLFLLSRTYETFSLCKVLFTPLWSLPPFSILYRAVLMRGKGVTVHAFLMNLWLNC